MRSKIETSSWPIAFAWLLAGFLLWGVWAARAGDGLVALQTADASCADDSGDRYVDCLNGTVTDNLTGLVWLADADCLNGFHSFRTLADFVAGLSDKPPGSVAAADDCGLSDGSSPGEWRLPSVEEWETMVAAAASLGCRPAITNDSGDDCWDPTCVTVGACSFFDVASGRYWSASLATGNPGLAWRMDLETGAASLGETDVFEYLWAVRGGQ